ncbi:carbohydrate sulfotransferase 11-like [Mizuhopecten yessoensis]|uniref:Carbohydrate sulfotransferase n=1 Tax=Mizuhopecten yessoensis TaxID=6573 RepID=A0A210QYM6_MIZYE|nr:carbohydrate sulfotransferase 11-like [Mizuhopecten yessoensis]OWF53771.1 Carbohydrate sulfotransferase 9 [Mizuhopecten yessoensis]
MGRTCTGRIRFIMLVLVSLLGMCWLVYAVILTHVEGIPHMQRKIPVKKTSHVQRMLDKASNILSTDFVMIQRKTAVMKMCKKNSTYNLPNRHHMVYNRNKPFLYCKATKAGSTFWGRLLLQIDKHRIASPYHIKPQIGVTNVFPTINEWKHIDAILRRSTKFIIARDPLERLYSAYVDKVFSPNPFYWDVLGTYIVKTFRDNTSKTTCGHDVTFPEFLQYAVHAETTGKHVDVHVLSLWKSCSPCHVKYDIIGKMETFKDDTNYILDKLNLEPYKAVLRNISIDAVNDALYDTAQAYVSMRGVATKCTSKQNTAERIWTKLKARGFIAADLPVPSNLFYKKEATVFEIFKGAYSKSVLELGRQGLKQQQNTIFLETFKRIPKHTLSQLAKTYSMDFQMFGYEQEFNEMFNKSTNSGFSISAIFF